MIRFSRENSIVYASIEVGVCNKILLLRYDNGTELNAELLLMQIEKQLEKRIEIIRRDAYNKGWKDKSSKKVRKLENFNCLINNDMVGW